MAWRACWDAGLILPVTPAGANSPHGPAPAGALGAFSVSVHSIERVSAVTTQEPVDVDTGGTSFEMSQEDAGASPVEKPVGSPQLAPLSGLPRKVRAEYWDHLRGINVDENGSLLVSSDAPMEAMADVTGMAWKMEQALRCAVLPIPGAKQNFDAWASAATDQDVMQLFAWYQSSFTPGEAAPSPTS